MKKNILIVSGSPRKKGNTMAMARILEEKMADMEPDLAFEYLYLVDRDLKYCLGCMNCLKRGGQHCPIKDDAGLILTALKKADGLVFLSPGYAHQVSAMFKNFLDRFMYLAHLPELVGVPTVVIGTAGYDGAGKIPRYIADWNLAWWGCDVVARLGFAHVVFTLNGNYRRKAIGMIEVAARDFIEAMKRKHPPRPSLRQYFYFLFNRMETEFCESGMPARYGFWKDRGWLESDYYYDTKVGLTKKVLGRAMLRLIESRAKKDLGRDYRERLKDYY
ncbi:MAG: flavodoxin family protein [Lentisphaerae bacterium]|nr:flavodoxin family protein [Lentisphaerota bacterium]